MAQVEYKSESVVGKVYFFYSRWLYPSLQQLSI